MKVMFARQNNKIVAVNTLSELKSGSYDWSTINAVLNDVSGFTINLQTIANTTNDLAANWMSNHTQLTTDIKVYLASFNMDDTFIR